MIAPLSGLFLAGDHAEQRGLAGAVRPDHADDAAGRQLEGEIVDQEIVAETLLEVIEIDHVLAEPLGHRDDDLRRLGLLVGSLCQQILVTLIARLRLGLPGARACGDPLLLARQRALVRRFLAALLFEPLLLLRQPGGVIALIRNAAAAIELEDPAGDIVQEIAVVGDDQDRARIVAQMAFQPGDRLGVEVVRGLVEQKEFRLLQQQAAERDAPPLAAREGRHVRVVRRAAQGIHRLVDLGIEVPQALGLDLVLQPRHLVRGLVRVVHGELVVAVEDRLLRRDAFHHVRAHALGCIELGLLRQVADAGAFGHPGLAAKLLVDAGHDAQQRRLARTVDSKHADLGVRIERQIDVLEHLAVARIGLGQTLHVVDELTAVHPVLLIASRRRGGPASLTGALWGSAAM